MRVVDKSLADSLEKNLGLRFDVLRPEAGETLQRAHESDYYQTNVLERSTAGVDY
jgi:hypothetical protein